MNTFQFETNDVVLIQAAVNVMVERCVEQVEALNQENAILDDRLACNDFDKEYECIEQIIEKIQANNTNIERLNHTTERYKAILTQLKQSI